jgi:hypothetical protein
VLVCSKSAKIAWTNAIPVRIVLLVVTQVRNDGCGPVISAQIAVRNVGYPATLHSIHQSYH